MKHYIEQNSCVLEAEICVILKTVAGIDIAHFNCAIEMGRQTMTF
jgi:hypothetical protein